MRKKLTRGVITGHVGYAESAYLIAYAGGVELTRVEEFQELVVAGEDVESAGIRVAKGMNRGSRGYAVGYVGDREVVRVELHAYVGRRTTRR